MQSDTVCAVVRLLGSEDNHMTASIAKVEIAWMDVSTSPYLFVSRSLIKLRDKFTLIFLLHLCFCDTA
jgi:hypothetical protein